MQRVDTKEFKASQYNHVTDACRKIPVVTKRRDWKAESTEIYILHFNSKCTDLDFKHPDRKM